MQEMIFQASQGYPMPECLCYNTADLRMLTEFYSGRTSELTTTMQYSYQSTILSSCRPEIAEAIGKDQYGGDAPHLAVGPVHYHDGR